MVGGVRLSLFREMLVLPPSVHRMRSRTWSTPNHDSARYKATLKARSKLALSAGGGSLSSCHPRSGRLTSAKAEPSYGLEGRSKVLRAACSEYERRVAVPYPTNVNSPGMS